MNIQRLDFISSGSTFSRPTLKNLYTYKNTSKIGSINSPYQNVIPLLSVPITQTALFGFLR